MNHIDEIKHFFYFHWRRIRVRRKIPRRVEFICDIQGHKWEGPFLSLCKRCWKLESPITALRKAYKHTCFEHGFEPNPIGFILHSIAFLSLGISIPLLAIAVIYELLYKSLREYFGSWK